MYTCSLRLLYTVAFALTVVIVVCVCALNRCVLRVVIWRDLRCVLRFMFVLQQQQQQKYRSTLRESNESVSVRVYLS